MADDLIFTNNASALLQTSINNSETTIQVASGFGALFPSPSGSQYFYASLVADDGSMEIVRCVSRTGDNLTVVRAQDGTTAQAFTATVTRVELRVVKIVLEEFLQKNGGTMAGDIDMGGNTITDAVLSGASTQILGGEIAGVPFRGDSGQTANQIVVPSGTGRATAGGAEILVSGDDIVAQLDTAGVIILDSATTGVRIPASAYLRIEGASAGDYLQMDHDDTDFNFTFVDVTEVNWDAVLNMTANLQLNENECIGAQFADFAVKEQSVTATTTTAIDYTAGSYVNLTLGTSINAFSITSLPVAGVASLRLKITSTAGTETIDWTDLPVQWSEGVEPTLSGAGEIDVVDLWTDDGGTTWFGAALTNFSTPP